MHLEPELHQEGNILQKLFESSPDSDWYRIQSQAATQNRQNKALNDKW